MRDRSWGFIEAHFWLSNFVRPQPTHHPLVAEKLQILKQGLLGRFTLILLFSQPEDQLLGHQRRARISSIAGSKRLSLLNSSSNLSSRFLKFSGMFRSHTE